MITGMLVGIVLLFLFVGFYYFLEALIKFVKGARDKQVLKGAAFWLTSLLLCIIFVGFGISFGLFRDLF